MKNNIKLLSVNEEDAKEELNCCRCFSAHRQTAREKNSIIRRTIVWESLKSYNGPVIISIDDVHASCQAITKRTTMNFTDCRNSIGLLCASGVCQLTQLSSDTSKSEEGVTAGHVPKSS